MSERNKSRKQRNQEEELFHSGKYNQRIQQDRTKYSRKTKHKNLSELTNTKINLK